MNKTSITDEEGQVNDKEHHHKSVDDEGKAEDQAGVLKVKVRWHIILTSFYQALFGDIQVATDLIIANS